jgi:hypothetical protein
MGKISIISKRIEKFNAIYTYYINIKRLKIFEIFKVISKKYAKKY